MVKRIIKRDGRVVDFDRDKIQSAIMKAVEAVGGDDDVEASRVTDLVVAELSKCEEEPQVEYIQDLVEKMLIEEGHAATAKEYILYRANRDRVREMNSSLMRTFEELSFGSSNDVELKRENANIDGDTAMGTMLRYGSESAKQFNLSYLVSPDIARAHRSGDIHIHDLDFMALTETCVSGDTKVIIRDDSNGDIRVVNAEYFDKYLSNLKDSMVKEIDGISIYSGGEFVRLVNCVRHRADAKRVLQIKTDYNELKVTDEHRIPVIRGGEIDVLKAKDIKVGDKLIVDSLGKSKTKTNLKSINLIDLLTNSDNIIIHNTDIILKAIKEKGHWDEFSNKVGSDNRWNGIKRGKYKMTVAEYKSAIRELNYIDESKLKLAYKRTRGMESINAELALTEELGKFIGYMLSDGSVTAHKIKGKDNIAKKACFTNKSKELICDFNRCTEVVFNNASINDRYTCGELSGTRLSGYLIYELFHGPLGVKNGAGDIELPEWVMSANMEFISGLLGGLIDGDGNVQSDGYRVSYGTASEKLAKGIRLLLLLLGIRSYIRKDSVKGTEVKFNDNVSIRNFDIYKVIITSDISRLKWVNSFKIKDSLIMGKAINERDTDYIVVTDIEEIDYSGYVYDFETGNHYFSANGVKVHNCCQIDLEKLFKGGFNTGHGYLREPGEIRSYAALACIAIQGNQNEMHGGQSIPAFDHYMAPGVAKSFIKELKKVIDIKYPQCNYGKEMETDDGGYLTNEGIYQELKRYRDKNRLIMNEEGYEFIRGLFRDRYCKHIDDVNDIIKMASNLTDDATHQAMEAVIHNLNSMHVRQVQY